MASPQSTTSHEGGPKKNLEQITFRFCSECSNMLYPKEDADNHKLQFTCRTCQYSEEANSTCVFRNVLNNAAGETAGVTQDVGSDPTVGTPRTGSKNKPQTFICLCCGGVVMCGVCGAVPASNVPLSPNMTVEFPEADAADAADPFDPSLGGDMVIGFADLAGLSEEYDFMEDADGETDDTTPGRVDATRHRHLAGEIYA